MLLRRADDPVWPVGCQSVDGQGRSQSHPVSEECGRWWAIHEGFCFRDPGQHRDVEKHVRRGRGAVLGGESS